jgi:hypothetical protein
MAFASYTNGAIRRQSPFNGFRPPYKTAYQITFPNIADRDAPGKTGAAAKPALVSALGIAVSGYDGATKTARFALWSSTGTSGSFTDLFTLPTTNTPALTVRTLPTSRTVFSSTKYWIGWTNPNTNQWTYAVDTNFPAGIREDNTNSGATSDFKNDDVAGAGLSQGSIVFRVDYDVLPTAPTSPAVLASGTTATFTWSAVSSDGGQAVTGYRIQRSTDGINFTTIVADTGNTSTSYTDANLTSGFTYFYRVAAINAVAVSAGSDYSGPYSTTVSAEVASEPGNAQSLLTVTVANPEPEPVIFTDFGTGIRFTSIDVSYGSEYLYNQIEASTQDSFAEVQVSEAPRSKELYGARAYSITGLLNSTDAGALDVAKDLLTYYYEPELRVQSITVDLSNLNIQERLEVLNLEIDSFISISFTPNGIGDPKIAEGLVTGISHRITITSHEIELRLRTLRTLFILNSDSKGILDQDILGP